jgi:alpha-D-xyloside xylohydrolase
MFGPAFLVAPVTAFRARSRQVYLPAGALWYDLHSGRTTRGGRSVRADAPYERMPLFARAGAIVPAGPEIQHTNEGRGGPITLLVYTGADGRFSLYEDDGLTRQYLDGAFARIPLSYDERTRTLTIGAREGRYPGMAEQRIINIIWHRPGRARPFDLDARPDATIAYSGAEQIVTMRR